MTLFEIRTNFDTEGTHIKCSLFLGIPIYESVRTASEVRKKIFNITFYERIHTFSLKKKKMFGLLVYKKEMNITFPNNARSITETFVATQENRPENIRNRIAIFASFNAKGLVEDYVIHYLKELKKITDGIVFVADNPIRSEEHTSVLQSHSEYSYAVFCLKKKRHITLFFHALLSTHFLLSHLQSLVLIHLLCSL